MQIKLMYKIHSARVAQGIYHSNTCNNTFYETEEAAIAAAQSYVRATDNVEDMVIYKAHVLVRKERPPVEVMAIESDGVCVHLSDRRV